MADEEITTEEVANQETTETQPAPSDDAPTGSDAPEKVETTDGGEKPVEAKDEPEAPAEKGELESFRELIAGGDEKLLKELGRYKSVESLRQSLVEARTKARNGGKPLKLSEKATDDEIKAYRESMGIPENAADYPVSFSEEFQASDADGSILDGFKEYMHGKNVDPAAAKAAVEWYQDFAAEQQQSLNENMSRTEKQTEDALRKEWGGDYSGNLGAVSEFMVSKLGQDGFDNMMGLRLTDGSRLQDNVAFVKMMADVATDYYGSNAIYSGDVETTAKSVDEKISELLQLRVDDPEKYKSDDVQSRITKLYEQRAKLNSRKG